jgi:YD repeat-containing protein
MKQAILLAAAALLFASPACAATTYTYDTLGRIATATYDNGKTITYTYDPAGNRTQVVTGP